MPANQTPQTPLQYLPKGRQIVPVHLSVHHPRFPANQPTSRHQEKTRQIFRPVSQRNRRQGIVKTIAKAVSRPPMRGQHLPQPHPALPAIPDRTLLRAVRRLGLQNRLPPRCGQHLAVFGRQGRLADRTVDCQNGTSRRCPGF